MVNLPNGCYCSQLSVHPQNWERSRPSLKSDWYIHYRFYDPLFKNDPRYKKGKQRIIKAGINQFKTVEERQDAVRIVIRRELHYLQEEGFNPITGKFSGSGTMGCDIHPGTPFIQALLQTLKRLQIDPATKVDVKSSLKYIGIAAIQLRYDQLGISDIKRRNIKLILDQCGRNRQLSPRRYNIYRAFLLMLFKELVELEAVEANPVHDISKMTETKKERVTLNNSQRQIIGEYLPEKDFDFWMFVNLFFHSGARTKELGPLKLEDVELNLQRYKVTIKKGKGVRTLWKTIKDIALPYWEFFLKKCKPGDFVFGSALKNRSLPLLTRWVGTRWQKLVKKELGIPVDFYSLKHLNTSEVVDALDEKAAADLNSHTSTAMVIGIYDVKQAKRKHDKLKGVANKF